MWAKRWWIVTVTVVAPVALTGCLKNEPGDNPPLKESSAASAPTQGTPVLADPRQVHDKALVIDTHIDVPYRLSRFPADISQRLTTGHFDFVRAREGGLDASFFSVYVSSKFNGKGTAPGAKGGAYAEAMRIIDKVETLVSQSHGMAAIARTPDEVEKIVAAGQHAIVLGLENGSPIEGSVSKLEQLYQRGVRYVTLTHSKDNHLSDSSYDRRRTHGGLSDFGRHVVTEMNRLGMLIDVSHLSDQAFEDVLAVTQTPVIASHSSLRTFRNFERNMSDDMVKALAKNGGVIHISFGSSFLRDSVAKAIKDRNRALRALTQGRKASELSPETQQKLNAVRAQFATQNATLDDVVAHIEHAVKLVGANHVGLGSDYDGVVDVPADLPDVAAYPKITAALMERGHAPKEIRQILGGNLMRVWRENIKHAQREAAMRALQQ